MQMTIKQIHDAMHAYNQSVAYGSECNAWQDFVADCHDRVGFGPWSDSASETDAPDDFAEYWLDVANGNSSDFIAETGSRVE